MATWVAFVRLMSCWRCPTAARPKNCADCFPCFAGSAFRSSPSRHARRVPWEALADVAIPLGHFPEAGPFRAGSDDEHDGHALALGDALALVASRARGFTRQQFALFHPAGSLGKKLQSVKDVMRDGDQLRIAPETATIRQVFVSKGKPGRRTGAVMLVDADDRLAGLFTDSDLVRLLEGRRENQLDRPISEVMTAAPKHITAEAPLSDAIALLSQYRISELPVIDEQGRPVGLVDITDLIALMPDERME